MTHASTPVAQRSSSSSSSGSGSNKRSRARTTYAQLLTRLSEQSVRKHFDAYADIPWDSEGFEIDAADSRWAFADTDLGPTAWYQGQAATVQAQIRIDTTAARMKVGIVFENVLARGLLEFADTLPNGSPEYRYAMHEVIEEGQHSLMFQEFINRSGSDPMGPPTLLRWLTGPVARLGRHFPCLFFFFVLGGEAPIDFEQRGVLRRNSKHELPPVLHRVMRIHVTEEARHLCFAQQYLEVHVPQLPWYRRWVLMAVVPVLLFVLSRAMLGLPRDLVRRYRIPGAVLKEAYGRSVVHRGRVMGSLAGIERLCGRLGLIPRSVGWLWRVLGIASAGMMGGGARGRGSLRAAGS